MNYFDCIVVGGGLVGSAQAAALANAGLNVALVERYPFEAITAAGNDGRASAIALASRRVLEHIGVWQEIAEHAEPIYDIRVVDEASTAFVHFHYQDAQVADAPGEPFGHIIDNDLLRAGLVTYASQHERITAFAPAEITELSADAMMASVMLSDGQSIKAPLILACDGKFSTVREKLGIRHRWVDYQQTAVVCTVAHEQPHDGVALERFLPGGPFAALPMKDYQGKHRSGIVWSETTEEAERLLQLDDAAFEKACAAQMGEFWGEVSVLSTRHSYPLKLMLSSSYIAQRVAFVGDSAHAIHPIAGQGVNLGYRDVAYLTDLVLQHAKLGLDIGSSQLLSGYASLRRRDALSMSAMTDGIDRLFSNDILPIRAARRWGLRSVEKIPPLKRFFMKQAMGLGSDALPPMMQPKRAA